LRICLRWLGEYLLACEVVSVDDIVEVWASVGWFVVGRVLWVYAAGAGWRIEMLMSFSNGFLSGGSSR